MSTPDEKNSNATQELLGDASPKPTASQQVIHTLKLIGLLALLGGLLWLFDKIRVQ